jgi:hypothetical protein
MFIFPLFSWSIHMSSTLLFCFKQKWAPSSNYLPSQARAFFLFANYLNYCLKLPVKINPTLIFWPRQHRRRPCHNRVGKKIYQKRWASILHPSDFFLKKLKYVPEWRLALWICAMHCVSCSSGLLSSTKGTKQAPTRQTAESRQQVFFLLFVTFQNSSVD